MVKYSLTVSFLPPFYLCVAYFLTPQFPGTVCNVNYHGHGLPPAGWMFCELLLVLGYILLDSTIRTCSRLVALDLLSLPFTAHPSQLTAHSSQLTAQTTHHYLPTLLPRRTFPWVPLASVFTCIYYPPSPASPCLAFPTTPSPPPLGPGP